MGRRERATGLDKLRAAENAGRRELAPENKRAKPTKPLQPLQQEPEDRDEALRRGGEPVPLNYADLVATLEPRNLETAKLVREKYIDDALRAL